MPILVERQENDNFERLSERSRKIAVSAFALFVGSGERQTWDIAAVGDNLFLVCYGDLDSPKPTFSK